MLTNRKVNRAGTIRTRRAQGAERTAHGAPVEYARLSSSVNSTGRAEGMAETAERRAGSGERRGQREIWCKERGRKEENESYV